MASSRTSVLLPSAVLILRLLTLGLLAASLALIAADKLSVDISDRPPQKYTFRDIYAYRYVLVVAVIGCAYTLVQLPLAAASIIIARGKQQRTIGRGSGGGGGGVAVALVLVLADVVFALTLATGAAAGFGFTYHVKRFIDGQYYDDTVVRTAAVDKVHRDVDRFFQLAYGSAALMLAAAACMALVIMLSVYSLAK